MSDLHQDQKELDVEQGDKINEQHTVPRTLKNSDGNSFAICVVDVANTPNGNVNPHHPILNGNLLLVILAAAKNNHTSPNPHITVAVNQPMIYRNWPAFTDPSFGESGSVCVIGKISIATFPSCIIAKPPCPRGPIGRNTETITSRGGRA